MHFFAYPLASESQVCIEIHCLEVTREVVIRLKMIEWGLFGLGSASTGLYVAEFFLKLGPYFGDLGGSNWPHIPFHMKKTSLGLMKIAFLGTPRISCSLSAGVMRQKNMLRPSGYLSYPRRSTSTMW